MKHYAHITVIGRDKTGVIARVTNFLFEQGANIEALEETVTRGQFSMILQASWAAKNWSSEPLRAGLDRLAADIGMEIQCRHIQPGSPQRAAILVTKEPHCLAALLKGFESGRLKAKPALVVGNHADLAPMARGHGIPFVHIPWDENRAAAEARLLGLLEEHEVDFILLARFMKILSPNLVWRYKNKIINIHPSLLPSFPGPQAYRQAHEHGVKIVGVTSHFVSMHLDEGPIIAQDSFRVKPGMTLKEIVAAGQKLEAATLVKAVRLYLARRLDVHWGIIREV